VQIRERACFLHFESRLKDFVAADDGKQITVEILSPKDARVRWKIVYAGNGAY